jgi:hypothetical protein
MNKGLVKKLILALTLVLVACLVQTSAASDVNGRSIVYGAGLQTCAQVMTPQGLSTEAFIWVAGFLSAYNAFTSNTYSVLSDQSEDASANWLRTYCQLNPVHTLALATATMIRTFYPTRQTTEPAAIVPPAPTPKPKTPPGRAWNTRLKPKDDPS